MFKTIPELPNDCVKSVQIRTRKNSVFGHSSRTELSKNIMKRIKNWLAETRFLLAFLIMLKNHVVLLKSEICFFFSFHNIDDCLWIDALVLLFNETLRYISKFFLNYRNPPAGIYLFKVNNENTRTNCEIWLKLTIQTLERCKWYRSGVLLLTLNVFHTLSSCFHPKKHFLVSMMS